MAARSIGTDDPRDPKRAERGLPLLIAAASSQHADVAADALDALESRFCAPLVPDPNRYTFVRTGPRINPNEVPWPIWITRYVMSALQGQTASRLKVIDDIGNGAPRMLSGRWDLYKKLLVDSDANIRNEAFTTARKVILQAVETYKKQIPQGQPFAWPNLDYLRRQE